MSTLIAFSDEELDLMLRLASRAAEKASFFVKNRTNKAASRIRVAEDLEKVKALMTKLETAQEIGEELS